MFREYRRAEDTRGCQQEGLTQSEPRIYQPEHLQDQETRGQGQQKQHREM